MTAASLPFPDTLATVPSTATMSGPTRPIGDAGGMSVIGTDLTILGENIAIISRNRLRIDGDVQGDVHGSEVTISREGSVVGTIAAQRIEVFGGVKGAIRAPTVIVHPTAEVDAEIVHQSLTVEEGATLDGSMRRVRDTAELAVDLDAAVLRRALRA